MGIFGFGSSSAPEQQQQQQQQQHNEEDLYSPSGNSFEQEESFGLEESGYEKMPDFMSTINFDSNRLQPMSMQGLDFLQLESSSPPVSASAGFTPSRNWSDDLCYGTGTTYLAGLTLGGAYGMVEGLKKSTGAPRVRLNTTLNTITRRGPGVGNAVGVIAMVYNGANSLLDYSRGTHDIFNSVAAGAAAGALFKSTAGPRNAAISAGVCAGVAGIWTVIVDTFTQ